MENCDYLYPADAYFHHRCGQLEQYDKEVHVSLACHRPSWDFGVHDVSRSRCDGLRSEHRAMLLLDSHIFDMPEKGSNVFIIVVTMW